MNREQKLLGICALLVFLVCLIFNLHEFDMWGTNFMGVLEVKPLLVEWTITVVGFAIGLIFLKNPKKPNSG